jgi:hypothetical protein
MSPAAAGGDMDPAAAIGSIAASFIANIFRELDEIIPVPEPSRLRVNRLFTFSDAVRYFAGDAPADPRIQGGALLKRPHARGQAIYQIFLDKADRVCLGKDGRPYGRAFVAENIDDELAAKFGDSDLIIFR